MTLTELTEMIEARKVSDLRDISNYLLHHVPKVDPIDWVAFKAKVMETFKLTDAEFIARIRQPIFFRAGQQIDDFLPLMHKHQIRGFLGRYVHHLTNTESPPAFHFLTGLTIMGTACRRNIWFDQKIFQIWPAIQSLILGPSGKMGKTTCTSYGMKLGREAGVLDQLAEEITPEALKQSLATSTKEKGEAVGILYASELSLLFAKSDSYNQGLIQSLTDLFDSRDGSRKDTKTAGKYELKNIAVSFLGCSNEGWATTSVPEHAVGGGLIGRMLVGYQADSDREVPFPEFPDPKERTELVKMLKMIPIIKGEFEISEEGREWYKNKYHWIKTHWPEDDRLEPFWARYGIHLLRLGMLMRVNEMIDDAVTNMRPIVGMPRVMKQQHLEQADALLLWQFQYLPRVFSFLGISGHGEEIQKVLRYIDRQGGKVKYNALARAMAKHMSGRSLKDHLNYMENAGMVKVDLLPPPHLEGKTQIRLLRKLEEM